jgi:hypothetical protein
MGRVKGMVAGFKKRIDAVSYRCEYLKECDEVNHNAGMGETVTVANIKREATISFRRVRLGVRNSTVNLG